VRSQGHLLALDHSVRDTKSKYDRGAGGTSRPRTEKTMKRSNTWKVIGKPTLVRLKTWRS
jgi:hypothetical protein